MASRFFDAYFKYIGVNEAPTIFHRWTAVSIIGTLLARNIYLPFGHSKIYPNMYILLTGTPGARKGTAIKIGIELLENQAIGYNHIAPDKAAKEAFWDWMVQHKISLDEEDLGIEYDFNLDSRPTEAYIAQDEFLDFAGIGDDGLITNLGNLWDNRPKFENPKTRGKSVYVYKPTINILGGITPTGISEGFRRLAIGGGFFSRVLFIYSNPTGNKVTFPDLPDQELRIQLLQHLKAIQELEGQIKLSKEVRKFLDKIYKSCPGMPDPRFTYYIQRRFTHLLKLVTVLSAMRLSLEPTIEDCIYANTILYSAELAMPKALGEYGKSKFADISNTIISILNNSKEPLTIRHLWKQVSRDLNKFSELGEIIQGLLQADKIQKATIKKGTTTVNAFLANNAVEYTWPEELINFSLLYPDEHTQPLKEDIKL